MRTIFKVTLTLVGPVVAGATGAGAFGVDLPFQKDHAGRFHLPGSHVKGLVREALTAIQSHLGLRQQQIDDWFGQKSFTEANIPHRGRLIFGDFPTVSPVVDGTRSRIEMDERRGAAKKGALLVIEAPFAGGAEAKFEGRVTFFPRDDQERDLVGDRLLQGLRWLPALGSQRGVGFGRLKAVAVAPEPVDEPPASPAPEPAPSSVSVTSLGLAIRPDAPFCLAKAPRHRNVFESETFIAGATIKGALASTLNLLTGRRPEKEIDETLPAPFAALGRHFSALRFLHAWPVPGGETARPIRPPLSLVRAPDAAGSPNNKTYDVALCPGPGLIHGRAPAFDTDWKDPERDSVEGEFGWKSKLKTELLVRTGISTALRRAAEGQLFAYEMVRPGDLVWLSRVDLDQVPDADRDAVSNQLQQVLAAGLKNLGKTNASARVECPAAPEPPDPSIADDGLLVVTLQTPALMLDPDPALNAALVDRDILHQKYQAFWHDISNQLELVDFFAAQRLAGGYLYYRFLAGQPYNPFLLTAEGSVFVLKTSESEPRVATKQLLSGWLTRGLPLPAWVHRRHGRGGQASWRTCPFIPENGFGEIAINHDCHVTKRPQDPEWEVLS